MFGSKELGLEHTICCLTISIIIMFTVIIGHGHAIWHTTLSTLISAQQTIMEIQACTFRTIPTSAGSKHFAWASLAVCSLEQGSVGPERAPYNFCMSAVKRPTMEMEVIVCHCHSGVISYLLIVVMQLLLIFIFLMGFPGSRLVHSSELPCQKKR